MSTSNSKFRTGSKEAPTEPFKRAVTSCLRAIAKAPELDVTFAAERPGLAPGKARLPEPARKMTKRDAAIVRGHADSIALKLACHDPKVHRKLMPGNPQARGVFEAVEQARVEAIGARRILEIGTLGGYSTIWLARRFVPGGRLITLELDPRCAEVARANLARAGLAECVEVRVGRALDTLPSLTAEAPFDLIFIDADKPSTPD